MKELIDTAIKAAKEAGALLNEYYGKIIKTEKKADRSLVTVVDKESELLIIKQLRSAFPHHQIIGEESGLTNVSDRGDAFTWVIDPLDGTHNFVRGISMFGVSIGLIRGSEFLAGIIYLPCTNDLYVSEKGSGAYKNDTKIIVSTEESLRESTVAYDSGFKAEYLEKLSMLQKIAPEVFNVRIFGASVRNLTYLAEGKVDVILEFDDKIWDCAAGVSMVLEAGGLITDHKGNRFTPNDRSYLATNGKLHSQMLELLKSD
jgi:myo-inositol-1(or 4)-monophosphatase